jgi:hypothetical protein
MFAPDCRFSSASGPSICRQRLGELSRLRISYRKLLFATPASKSRFLSICNIYVKYELFQQTI